MDYSMNVWERSHSKVRLKMALRMIIKLDTGVFRLTSPMIYYFFLIYGSAPDRGDEYGEG